MTGEAAENSYDAVPYPSHAYSPTHPDHLATLATLSGQSPPPVTRCRVLELGCASGGNLIPMAYSLPESEFVGIDLSSRQIAEGQEAMQSLGIENVSLYHLNILDIAPSFGQFDYIIVYGIYSWVDETVQNKILDICRQNLVPNGVAYVSYNAYPGWCMNAIVRDAMLYRIRDVTEPRARIEAARSILRFLAESVPKEHGYYRHFMNKVLDLVETRSDEYLFHDFIETVNEPVYFYEFIERAKGHGLQYLANAELATLYRLSDEVTSTVFEVAPGMIQTEQYIDFLTSQSFRQTLLCHQDVPLSRTLKPERLASLYVASRIESVPSALDIQSSRPEEFKGPDNVALSTAHPLTKAALRHLIQAWPGVVSFDRLLTLARSNLSTGIETEQSTVTRERDARVLGTNLLHAYSQSINLVEFHTYVPHFVLEVSERPIISPVARFQAKNELPVTNLYHQRVNADRVFRHLLEHLDGSRDRQALLEVLAALEAQGILEVKQDGQPVEDVALIRRALEEKLETMLHQTMQAALLVG